MSGLITWTPGITLEAIEQQVVQIAYHHYRGNKTATASALGIAIRTLDNKLEKYEANVKTEKEREEHERIKRERFLARSRGEMPDNVFTGAPARDSARPDAGLRMESVANASPESPVSMPERKEVQSVLPKHVAQGHPRKSR